MKSYPAPVHLFYMILLCASQFSAQELGAQGKPNCLVNPNTNLTIFGDSRAWEIAQPFEPRNQYILDPAYFSFLESELKMLIQIRRGIIDEQRRR